MQLSYQGAAEQGNRESNPPLVVWLHLRRVGVSRSKFWPLLLARSAFSQTNAVSGEEIPPLRPLRGEMPPSFTEQYGLWLLFGGIFALILVCVIIWLLTRPKPPRTIAPAVEARSALEALRQRAEDGAVVMRVSQTLRRYLAAAFEMPPEELTTTEFCQALTHARRVGPELSTDVARFLRECDMRKFAPSFLPSTAPALGAVQQALKLIDEAEARLTQLRQAATVAPPVVQQS
jgi:hypothetical protein